METDKTKHGSILRVVHRDSHNKSNPKNIAHRVSFGDITDDDVGREHTSQLRAHRRRSTESDLANSLHSLTSSGGRSGGGSDLNTADEVKDDTMDQKKRKKGKKWKGARTLMSSFTQRQLVKKDSGDAYQTKRVVTAPASLMHMKLPEDSETNNSTFALMPSFSGQNEANNSSEGMKGKVRRISLKMSRNSISTKTFMNERKTFAQSMPPSVGRELNEASLQDSAPPASNTRRSMSTRRECLDAKQLTMGLDLESANFLDWMTQAKCEEWLKSLRRRDPRFCIKQFFDDVARDGADSIEAENRFQPELLSPLLSMFQRSSVFSVWRPTSVDSIRKMMTGQGTGKGLDIKGKSAKKGKLSAYVPFLQIHEDEHKTKIRSLPRDGRIRVFYKKREARDNAHKILSGVMADMTKKSAEAIAFLLSCDKMRGIAQDDDCSIGSSSSVARILRSFHSIRSIKALEEEEKDHLRIINEWEMENPLIIVIDDYSPNCFGLDMPKRLFWEGYVMRAEDITRPPGSVYDTGRPSRASFQDMNFASIKNEDECDEDSPRAVVWQYTDPYLPTSEPDPDPMMPQTLLVAYEEHGRVMPVVSDFDCFLLGTRGVRFHSPLPQDQVELVHSMLGDIEKILKDCQEGKSHNWTASWLDKMKHKPRKNSVGKKPMIMPKYGFGDPKSYAIMKFAVQRLEEFGAVRHGAECFNYYFPQELDDEFLVIGGNLGGAKYKYMKLNELQEFLSGCIDLGFTYPLNPKWVLCDQGWKALWDKLIGSTHPNVQLSIDAWYPPGSNLRERIESIHEQYPQGFQSDLSGRKKGTQAWDEAEIALDRYQRIQRAKRKLWCVLCWIRIVQESQKRVKARKEGGESTINEDAISNGTDKTSSPGKDNLEEIEIEKLPDGKRVSFMNDQVSTSRRSSMISQITSGTLEEDDEIEPPSQDQIVQMGKSNLRVSRAQTFEEKPPTFSERFRQLSSLGCETEDVDVIDSLLNSNLPMSEFQLAGLQRIREQLANANNDTLSVQSSQHRKNNRFERRHTSTGYQIKPLAIGDVPQFILDEYGGAKGDIKISFKDSVKRIMNAQRVIGAIKSAEPRPVLRDDKFLPIEWTSMSKESKQRLAERLSFEALSRWDYNIIELTELCDGSPLLFVGWAVLGSPHAQQAMANDLGHEMNTESEGYNFSTDFGLQMPILCSFLRTVEAAYLPNPYHNNTHAADVVQTLNTMLQLGGKLYASTPLHLFSILVAAVIHDVQHPGLNNNFQINSHSELAVQYNDVSVLENYSITWFFSKLLGKTRDFTVDIFSGLTSEQFSKARSVIIKSVLETDMSHHFALLKKIGIHKETFKGKDASAWLKLYTNEGVNYDPSMDMLCFLLHQADISNPAKPYPLFVDWADKILEESHLQGDKEVMLSLPVSFLCDRNNTDKKQSQIGFIKFVVQPSYQLLGSIIPLFAKTVFPYVEKSLDFWDKYEPDDLLRNASMPSV